MRNSSIGFALAAVLLAAACAQQPSTTRAHAAASDAAVTIAPAAAVPPGDVHAVDRATTASDYCVQCHTFADDLNSNHPVRVSLAIAATGPGYLFPPDPAIVLREGVWVECSSCHDDGSAGFPRRTVLADTCAGCHDDGGFPPYTTITSPVDRAAVSGTIQVVASASGVVRAELWGGPSPYDTALLQTAVPAGGTVTYTVDTTALADGPFTFLVRVYDASGGNDSSYVRVQVSNPAAPPVTVQIGSPAPNALVRGIVPVLATAANATQAELWYLGDVGDGIRLATAPVAPDGTVAFSFDSRAFPDGSALLTVVGTGPGGTSQHGVATRIDNTPPAVALTAPADGTVVRFETTLAATAEDANGISSVAFHVDGVLLATRTAAPYEVVWTPARRSGLHTLTAVATDVAGNVATSAAVSVQAK
ncbi:MAG TPA: Ig-like domain-containing protein [Anaeromyxobacter sp.]|nr:Ig-like domain-containing protein [Anaeromyxobacter sp.]